MTRRSLTALVVVLAACGAGLPERGFSVRDSAGVEIVSNPASVAGDSGCVAVDSVPSVTIGGADAEGPYDLLRVGGALRLADGGVVVLNAGTSELRFFDSAGRYAQTFGRAGSGPGEFRSPSGLFWYGSDTLMVGDYGTARVTVLSTDGRLIEAIALRDRVGGGLVGRLADGSFVFSATSGYGVGVQTGRRRDPVHLVRVSAAGELLDTLGSFPGWEAYVEGDAQRTMVTSAAFGLSTDFQVAAGRVYVADDAEYRVREYADGRRLVRIVERAYTLVPLTPAVVEREKSERLGATTRPQFRELVERMYQSDRLPATLPVHGEIVVDADGWLWVRAYSTAREGDVAWDVFDESGRLRCAPSLPVALSVHEIGREFVLGVFRDEDGVEHVRLYGLRRGVRPTS